MKNARLIAAQALLKLERREAWSNLTLDRALEHHTLKPEEAALAAALFYGVIERRITLDACIAAHSAKKPEKLDAPVLCALRLGIYQILYMDSIPHSAAVDESVKQVKKLRKTQASGYVNGVLRSFLRAGAVIPLPEHPLSARLSVEFSCPEPLVKSWLSAYGESAVRRFLSDSVGRAPAALRVNTLRTSSQELMERLAEENIIATPHPHVPNCLMAQGGALHKTKAFGEGLFHLQDPASQLCALALEVSPGMRVLDACAAPGGKSFTIAQQMNNQGQLIACDLHPKRVGLIEKRAKEMGLDCINAQSRDMTEYDPALGTFDRVLCDVPCSGYGVIRRKPEIKYKKLEEFTDLPNIQYKILETTAQYCKVGGVLLYSTCTIHPAENGAVRERFLAAHPEFSPRPLGGLLGEDSQCTLMGEWDADGFYLAAFTRREEP
jgi:16S rRNA (cytosine967-C5)-methyltransferase